MRHKRIYVRQPVERKPDHDKRHHLVDKGAVGHDDGAVGLRLVHRVVSPGGCGGIVLGTRAEDGELFFNVFVDGQDDGDGGHEDCADEGFDKVCEGGGEAG